MHLRKEAMPMKLSLKWTVAGIVLAGASLVSAQTVTKATAELQPTEGHSVKGTVSFVQKDGGVEVTAHVTGLTPGKHGFHIHAKGDCSAPDGSSAGGHFNPTNQPHAGPDAEHRHVGDMGNIEANADGVADMSYLDHVMRLNGENSIIGRGVIVHGGADDLTSQPSGNAGPRVACGVIEAAKE
jgi:superoxide dismutase, Cu-Zn family